MTIHHLKTVNPHFNDIWEHNKHFEIRYNDRCTTTYCPGDKTKVVTDLENE